MIWKSKLHPTALIPRIAGILKHSTHTKTWLVVQIAEQVGLLPLADDW